MLLCGAVALSSACSDENKNNNGGGGGEEPTENVLTLGGNEYLVSNVLINYYGDYYETGDTERIYVVIHGVDLTLGIFLDILLPDGVTTLEAGTYTVGDDFLPNTILLEASGVANAQGEAYITGGTIEVSKSGNLYTVIFDLETEAGALTGTCEQEFDWVDETEPPIDATLSGNVSIGGESFPIIQGGMLYYPEYSDAQSANVVLDVTIDDYSQGLYFDIYTSPSSNALIAGTYTLADTFDPNTIYTGGRYDVAVDQNYLVSEITGGTLAVAQ